MSKISNDEKTFRKLLNEFNENIDKLFQKAKFTSMLILNETNKRIEYELKEL